jgi:hypothetical protein
MRRDRNKAKALQEENSKELMHAKLCNGAVQVKDPLLHIYMTIYVCRFGVTLFRQPFGLLLSDDASTFIFFEEGYEDCDLAPLF